MARRIFFTTLLTLIGSINWAIAQTNLFPASGNVGIGTVSPSEKLQVVGGAIALDANQPLRSGGKSLISGNATEVALGTTASGVKLRFHAGALDRMVIDATTGFVGFGITSPTFRLDVSGRVKLRSSTNTAGLWFTGSDGVESAFIGQQGISSSDPLGIYHGGAWRMAVLSNGNVGIGNTAPQYKLDVTGTIRGSSFVTAGNLGIGVTSPTRKIDVVGRMKVRGDASGSSGIFFTGSTGVESAFVGQTGLGDNDPLGIYHGGAWRMAVLSNGNVGIGTNAPTQKLTVNGIIYGKEIKVDATVPGPDYVFEDTYDLMSLTKLGQYVKDNKHLPEIPSAEEMKNDGINVSEMNLLLLKKVEELTLYVLELKKVNDAQDKLIQELQKKQY